MYFLFRAMAQCLHYLSHHCLHLPCLLAISEVLMVRMQFAQMARMALGFLNHSSQ
jgi:hypothetical protein